MRGKRSLLWGVAGLLVLSVPAVSVAQIPETFTNLQVLPAETSREELVGVMRGFASALRVRCSHCHVGEHGDSLEGFDFAADDKEPKQVAREMMKMTAAINRDFLPRVGRETTVEVKCVTCHRRTTKPQSFRDALLEIVANDGVEAAEARYRELRESSYGRGIYDFGPGTLNNLSETLAKGGRLEDAVRLLRFNLEYHPEAPYSHFLLGQALLQSGSHSEALQAMERAVELEPDNPWYAEQLESARAAVSGGDEP